MAGMYRPRRINDYKFKGRRHTMTTYQCVSCGKHNAFHLMETVGGINRDVKTLICSRCGDEAIITLDIMGGRETNGAVSKGWSGRVRHIKNNW